MAICEHCKGVYEAKRETSRYCSARCRQYANRGVSVTDAPQVSVTGVSVTPVSVTGRPLNYGQSNCECGMCRNNRGRQEKDRLIINHGQWKPIDMLADNEVNRVAIPGDVDYARPY